MSKADKMFEKLGYKISTKLIYTKKTQFGAYEQIHFDELNKYYYKTRQTGMNTIGMYPIDIEEHLAINNKIKELGWLNE